MNQNDILKQIAKDHKMSFNKIKMTMTVLYAGINACLEKSLFALDIPPGAPDTRETFTTDFMLAGRPAVVKACEIGHYEISIAVAVPNAKCRDPYYSLHFPNSLRKCYDLICFCWLERKTGKFIQNGIRCYTKKDPWITSLLYLEIKPIGYGISTKFF